MGPGGNEMKVMLMNSDDMKSIPLYFEFEKPPELGHEIIVDGKKAWINSIGRQIMGVDLNRQWHGQYTFNRRYYFK